jgi:type II secretory pathway pseudopilin PulG
MKTARKNLSSSRPEAFSLVEVTIAIGIFAFVVVGVMGLLPAGMKMRAESSAETRGVLIAEELFASVRAATNFPNVVVRIGPKLNNDDLRTNNIADPARPMVLGYPVQTTLPLYYYWRNPQSSWTNLGGADQDIRESAVNSIETLAKLSAVRLTNGSNTNLYLVEVVVRSPASLPLANCRPASFSTIIRSP